MSIASFRRRFSSASSISGSRSLTYWIDAVRVGDDVADAPGQRAQEARDRLRVRVDELLAGDDRVAVDVHPVVRVFQHYDVLVLDAARVEVEEAGEVEAGDRVDLAAREHRLAQRRIHRLPLDLRRVEVVRLDEDRERAAPGVEHRRAHRLAVEVRRLGDARLLEREHGRGRHVVEHVDGLHARRGVALVGREELDHRADVGEAHVVRARGDARDRTARAVAGVDDDVQALLLEIALRDREQEERRRAFEPPVELEADAGRLLRRRGRGERGEREPGDGPDRAAARERECGHRCDPPCEAPATGSKWVQASMVCNTRASSRPRPGAGDMTMNVGLPQGAQDRAPERCGESASGSG